MGLGLAGLRRRGRAALFLSLGWPAVCALVLGIMASSCGDGGEIGPAEVGGGGQTSAGSLVGGAGGHVGGAGGGCADEELCDGLDNDCDGQVDQGCACAEGETQPCYSGDPATEGVGSCVAGEQLCDLSGQWGPCEGEVTPETESCNAADDDCDGEVDEDFGAVTCGIGICQVTVEECVDGQPQPCVPGPPNPGGESCEGTDDDCDGFVDEMCNCLNGSTQPCYTGSSQTQNVGECQDGVQTCVQGVWSACMGDVLPAQELCDGLDNDCDAQSDENNPEGGGPCNTGQPGVCLAGTQSCQGGQLVCTQNQSASPEQCDGLDNDCDGQSDEGNPGGGGTCSTGQQGVCASGILTCQLGSLTCVPQQQPSAEVCDGLDNDCDGALDDGNPGSGATCTTGLPGVCSSGTTACQMGTLACMPNTQPSNELCDNLDNDCDGTADEGNPGGGVACTTGQPGVCSAGTTACQGGSVSCVQNQSASAEVCDGADNDCDGTADEGNPGGGSSCTTGQPGICSAGTLACSGGALACQQNQQPLAEQCNGADDDCDGASDEGNPGGGSSCDSGQQGVCQAGTTQCSGGTIACSPNVAPSSEACDGLDNDCDGSVDEGCNCINGQQQSCYTGPSGTQGVGLCTVGTQSCSGGQWGPCQGQVTPTAEQCDGVDNDCDGQSDENDPGGGMSCSTGQSGVCAAGTTSCQMGAIACVQNTMPSTESCDGLDNDCDGQSDEGNPGGGSGCDTGQLGVCQAGTSQCSGGTLACVPNTAASPEVCDGLDNDCDGSVDDGDPGGGSSCSTGLSGACSAGTLHCQGAQLVCQQNQTSSAESCDGVDNDCDGQTDEGNPGGGTACSTGQLGVCGAGTTQCSGGALQCSPNQSASSELCDGLDNDCDGSTDENNPGGGTSCSTGLLGVCQAGTSQCSGGTLSCVQNQSPSSEACDGLDNDCDGSTDENNPGGGTSCNTGQPGVCAAGTSNCNGGTLVCNQNTQPSSEVCDNLDNDCDNQTDEGNPGGGLACSTGQFGVCSAGTTQCQSGALACLQDQQPSAEICGDTLDNDCNGFVDDGCGGCSGGTFNCDGQTSNGCECTVGTGCCGTSCQTQHDNGLGQFFYDCVAAGTFNATQAMKACAAFTGNPASCTDYGAACSQGSVVCGSTSPNEDCACWGYAGQAAGYVYNHPPNKQCLCPLVGDPMWD